MVGVRKATRSGREEQQSPVLKVGSGRPRQQRGGKSLF